MSAEDSSSHICAELDGAEVHCESGNCPHCSPEESDLAPEEVRKDVSSPEQTRAALDARITEDDQ